MLRLTLLSELESEGKSRNERCTALSWSCRRYIIFSDRLIPGSRNGCPDYGLRLCGTSSIAVHLCSLLCIKANHSLLSARLCSHSLTNILHLFLLLTNFVGNSRIDAPSRTMDCTSGMSASRSRSRFPSQDTLSAPSWTLAAVAMRLPYCR